MMGPSGATVGHGWGRLWPASPARPPPSHGHQRLLRRRPSSQQPRRGKNPSVPRGRRPAAGKGVGAQQRGLRVGALGDVGPGSELPELRDGGGELGLVSSSGCQEGQRADCLPRTVGHRVSIFRGWDGVTPWGL